MRSYRAIAIFSVLAAGVLAMPRIAHGEGACCVEDDCYDVKDEDECIIDEGGVYQGDGTTCDLDGCPGACCLADGSCVIAIGEDDCLGMSGEWQGFDSTCEGQMCTGACGLVDDDECVDGVTRDGCAGLGGLYWSSGSECAAIGEKFLFRPAEYVAPHVALAGDGSFAVVYPLDAGGQGVRNNLFARYFDATGREVAGPIQVNDVYEFNDNSTADVAMNEQGEMAVAWQSGQGFGGDEKVALQVFGPDGTRIGIELVESYPNDGLQGIEVAMQDTRIVVGWNGAFPGLFSFARFDLDRDAGLVTKRGDTIDVYDEQFIEFGDGIGIDLAGDTIATAVLDGSSGLYYQTFSYETGTPLVGRLELDTASVQRNGLDVEIDSAGRTLVAWVPFTGMDTELFGRFVTPAGDPDGPAFKVNEGSDGFIADISVLAIGPNQWKVIWYNNGQNAGINGIFSRSIDDTDSGAVERISAIGANQYPTAATNAVGDVVATWYTFFRALPDSSAVFGVIEPSPRRTSNTVLVPAASEGVEGSSGEGTALGAFSNTAQIVYGADLLAEAGIAVGDRLTGLAFRVDVANPAPVWSVSDYQVRLATSLNPPGHLDPNFVNNRGADYTVVRAGPLDYDGSEYPTGESPNEFGETIGFDAPFTYAGGDLLLEYTHTEIASGGVSADAAGPDQRVESQFAPGFDGTIEGFGGGVPIATVIRFDVARLNVHPTDGNGLDLTPVDDGYDGTLGSMASLSLDVPDCGTIVDVDVTVDIAHTWTGDLVVKLESPAGTVVDLWSRAGFDEPADDGSGCCGESSDLVFDNVYEIDDDATESSEAMGSGGEEPIDSFVLHSSGFANEFGLTTLNGEDARGEWTLYVGDSAADDNGTFDGFTLAIVTGPCCDPENGDVTGDGCVSFADVLAILGTWGTTNPDGDANCDGVVTFADILVVLGSWGNGCP